MIAATTTSSDYQNVAANSDKKSNQILHKLLSACVNSVRRKETAHGLDYKANRPKNSI